MRFTRRILCLTLTVLAACNGRLLLVGSTSSPLTHSLGQFALGNSAYAQNIAVSSGVSSEGDGLVLYMPNDAAGQQFQVLTDDNGHYALVEQAGGRCLSVASGAASIVTCGDAASQLFTVAAAADGAWTLVASDASCLDAVGAWSSVDASACSGAPSQAWTFQGPVPFSPSGPGTPVTPTPPTQPVDAGTPIVSSPQGGPTPGTYQLLNVGVQQNVAVNQGTSFEGDTFVLFTPNSAAGQLFAVSVSGAGYQIQEQAGDRCLDASGASLTMVTCNGSAEQTFKFAAQANSSWALISSAGSCINGQGAYNLLDLEDCSGAPAQLWQLTSAGSVVTQPTPPPTQPVGSLPQSFRLMTLGDSMTAGYDSPDTGGYRGFLYQLLLGAGYTPQMVGTQDCGASYLLPSNEQDCDGVGGRSIEGTDASVVAGSVLATNPDVILLLVGFNTVAREPQYSISQDLGFMSQLVDDIYAQKPNARLIVASMIDSTQCCSESAIEAFNAGVPGIVQAKKNAGFPISFVDMFPVVPVSGLDPDDLVHPNPQGYQLLAQAWLQAIQAVAAQ